MAKRAKIVEHDLIIAVNIPAYMHITVQASSEENAIARVEKDLKKKGFASKFISGDSFEPEYDLMDELRVVY